MRTFLTGFILTAATLVRASVGEPVCPTTVKDIHDAYAGKVPVADGREISCARTQVDAGSFNDCELKAYVLACVKGLSDLQKNYNTVYIANELGKVLDTDLRIDYPQDPVPVEYVRAQVATRNGAAQPPKDEKGSKLLGDRWTFTRKLSDSNDPRGATGTSIQVPFVASLQEDRVKDRTTSTVYGTIGYRLFDATDRVADVAAQLAIDSSTADPASKSSLVFSLPYTSYFVRPLPWLDTMSLSISPQYQTDRDFDRKAYQLSASASFASTEVGRMGQFTCIPDPACIAADEQLKVLWKPSLGLDAGHVQDAAGNASLAMIQKDGTYYRLVPSISLQLLPLFLSPHLTFQLTYRQRYDLSEGWNRGYGEANFLYALNDNLFFTVIYRKGRKDVTFDRVDSVLLGFGYSQK